MHVVPAEMMLWSQSIDGIDHKIQEAVEELSATSYFNLIKTMATIMLEKNKKVMEGVRNHSLL